MLPVVHVVVYVAAALELLVVAGLVWRRRAAGTVTATSIVVVTIAAAWWSVADAVIATGVGAPVAGITALATFPAIAVIVAGLACLGRSTNGSGWVPSRRVLAGLAVEPVLVTIVAATNPWHLALYGGPGAATLGEPNAWQHGTLFWVHTAYSYVLIAVGLGMLARGFWRSPPLFRHQRQSLLLAALVPALVTVVNLVGRSGSFGDPTPLGLALTAGIVAYAILRQDLVVLAPVARDVLFARISDVVIALSPDGRIIDLNPAAETLLRATGSGADGALIGLCADQVMARWRPVDGRPSAAGPDDTSQVTLDVSGRRTDMEVRRSPLKDRRGHTIGTVLVARDVTQVNAEHRQLEEQLSTIELLRSDLVEQATRDPLTNLYNRRHVMDRFGPLLAAAAGGAPLAVLMVDIDRFKRINDGHGHVVGDSVLVAMADRLLRETPAEAVVSRWGGEEFVVVLPGFDAIAGVEVAERVRARCEAEPFVVDGESFLCTVSVGVAGYTQPGTTAAELLEAADLSLYDAKADGRNLVRWCVADAVPGSFVAGPA